MNKYLLSAACIAFSFQSQAVVFGDNDMQSIDSVSLDQIEEQMSRPVAAMIGVEKLDLALKGESQPTLGDTIWGIFGIPGGNANGRRKICPDVKFTNEEAIATCSGVLIAPDLIATAAHCLWGSEISQYKWVFDFKDTGSIDPNKIYRAKEVVLKKDSPIKWEYSPEREELNNERKKLGFNPLGPDIMNFESYNDVAVIRLEKEVEGITPVEIDFTRQAPDTELTLIGFPFGLTKKITKNGVVVASATDAYTTNNLDVVKGNSGGPVFNGQSGKLVGLMVNQGRNSSFVLNRKRRCYEMKSYDESEQVADFLSGYMNIDLIREILP